MQTIQKPPNSPGEVLEAAVRETKGDSTAGMRTAVDENVTNISN